MIRTPPSARRLRFEMPIILIAACAGKRQVIGRHGRLPWHFPSDLKFFKQTTLDHAIIMGRKTYDAIIAQFGRPLPRRRNLVVSRDPTYRPAAAEVFLDIVKALAAVPVGEDVFVAGGEQIFTQTLPLADGVLLTHIEQEIDGDTFFPPLDASAWLCVHESQVTENGVVLRFCRYERIAAQ